MTRTSTRVLQKDRQVSGRLFKEFTLDSDSGVNPLSSPAIAVLRDAMRTHAADDHVQGLIIRATGRIFSAGADVKEFAGFDAQGFRDYMSRILSLYGEMTTFPKPVISIIHGDALGGGAGLAFFSDFVIAADTARFGLPEVHRGLAGGGYLMPKLIGKHRAAEMVLLGRTYSAHDMLAMGLVNEVCPAAELDARADALAGELSRLSVSAFAVGKAGLAAGLSGDLREAMQVHIEAQTQAFIKGRAEAKKPPPAPESPA